MYRVLILIFLLVFSIGLYFISPEFFDIEFIFGLLGISGFALILFFTRKENLPSLEKRYFKHSFIFIIGYFIVFFQYHIDFLLGNVNKSVLFIWINEKIVLKSLSLSVIGLISFIIGYLTLNSSRVKSTDSIQKVGTWYLVILACISLPLYFYFANPLYFLGYYGIVDLGQEAEYIIQLFQVFAFGALIQTSRNIRTEGKQFKNFYYYFIANNPLLNLCICLYLASVMFSGDRGPIIFFGLGYYGCYLFVTKNRLNIIKTIGIVAIGAFIINLLGYVRATNLTISYENRIMQSLGENDRFETTSFLPQTQELARSIRTLHRAVDYFPGTHEFLYGRFQFQQLLSIVPFGNSISNLLFSDNSEKYKGSAQFITWLAYGDHPPSGEGSSVIADFYIDFGVTAVVIGMFLVGLVMRYGELVLYNKSMPSLFSHCLMIGYLSDTIYLSRSTFLIEFKVIIWIYIVLRLNQLFFSKK